MQIKENKQQIIENRWENIDKIHTKMKLNINKGFKA